MISQIQASAAVETIADEQRLSSFADAIIGVSFPIINDLKFFRTDQPSFLAKPQSDAGDEAEEQIPNTSSKGGTEVLLGN